MERGVVSDGAESADALYSYVVVVKGIESVCVGWAVVSTKGSSYIDESS